MPEIAGLQNRLQVGMLRKADYHNEDSGLVIHASATFLQDATPAKLQLFVPATNKSDEKVSEVFFDSRKLHEGSG